MFSLKMKTFEITPDFFEFDKSLVIVQMNFKSWEKIKQGTLFNQAVFFCNNRIFL